MNKMGGRQSKPDRASRIIFNKMSWHQSKWTGCAKWRIVKTVLADKVTVPTARVAGRFNSRIFIEPKRATVDSAGVTFAKISLNAISEC